MYFMVEKTPSVTKYVDGHPCKGSNLYDSQNMPFVAAIGKTKIEDDTLRAVSQRYPEVRILSENEQGLASKAEDFLKRGRIKPSNKWEYIVNQLREELKKDGKKLEDLLESKKKKDKQGDDCAKRDVQDSKRSN